MNCLRCDQELIGRSQKRFCSKNCAAVYNNINFPKRSKEKKSWPKCKSCDQIVKRKSGKFCSICINYGKHLKELTISKTIEECSKRTGSNRYDTIRYNARNTYRDLLNTPLCENCKYDKHVEICHIKSISSFSKETLVSEVNNRKNIILLCPNCHWEFDRGLLKIGREGIEPSTCPL